MCALRFLLNSAPCLEEHVLIIFCRLIDSDISTPCSQWEQYRKSRTSWGINVLGSFLIEIEATDGTVGIATGFGGKLLFFSQTLPPATFGLRGARVS
jgi:hypothetical protein